MANRGRKGWGQQPGPPPAKKRKKLDVVGEGLCQFTYYIRSKSDIAPQACLAFLPDNILLHIMASLDIVSLVRLSRTSRRLHQLFSDESLWRDVDLGFMAECGGDVRKLKTFVRRWLGPATETVRMASNALSGHGKGKAGRPLPLVTASLLDEVVERCPQLTAVELRYCDLTQFPTYCKVFQCSTLTKLALCHCVTELRWMTTVAWTSLTHFSLAHTVKTSDADLTIIADKWSGSLRSLVLTGCYRLTDAGMQTVCSRLPMLTKLDVAGCKGLTKASLQHISKLRRLKRLSLAGLPDMLSGLEPQTFADMFSYLSFIDLTGCAVGPARFCPQVVIRT